MATDIAPEIYEAIKKSFDKKYADAEMFGESFKSIFARIKDGTATFREADMYAVEVGAMMSEAMQENIALDAMPNKTFYRNIANKTVGEGLKDVYGLVSTVTATIQEEINEANGLNLKAVKPILEGSSVDAVVDGAVSAKTQETLKTALGEPVKTYARRVVDDTQKANARFHRDAGLQVIVTREYDGVGLHEGSDACEWCLEREGTWTYDQALSNGVFERHEGCGCIIDYTSKKGEFSRSTSKSGFYRIENPKEREQEILKNASR